MPRDYNLKPLSAHNAALAYPLIQAALPNVSLDAWIAYAEKLNHPDPALEKAAGIVTAESKRGYIHGIFSYSVRIVLNHDSVLTVENFIALDMGDRAAAIKSLISGMENLAQDLGCSAIHTHVPDHWVSAIAPSAGMLDYLRDAGHNLEFVKFCKTIGTH
jgi:hypothetical protein